MSTNKQPGKRRTYTREFKQQLVNFYRSGKWKCDILREYDLSSSLLDKWIAQAERRGQPDSGAGRAPAAAKKTERPGNGERSAKAGGADLRTKVRVMKANAHKYRVSAMCRVLQVNRSTYDYEATRKVDASELTAEIVEIFRKSCSTYGTRKIKKELAKQEWTVSRRRISRIMKQEGLVSVYTKAQYRPQKSSGNASEAANILDRKFQG